MEHSLEDLDELLKSAASKLDAAAAAVQDLGLAPESNVKKIGEVLVNISQIQHEIYAIRLDLRPDSPRHLRNVGFRAAAACRDSLSVYRPRNLLCWLDRLASAIYGHICDCRELVKDRVDQTSR